MDKLTENSSNGAFSRQASEAAAGMHSAINSTTAAAKPAAEQLKATAHQATDRVLAGASKAASALEQQGKKWKENQAKITENCRAQLREKPMSSLGIAVAAGFLLAFLFKRSK